MEVKPGYKQTEVGVIPEDWEVKQIQEVCGFIVPGRNKPRVFEGNIPWITTPDLEDGKAVNESRLSLRVSIREAKAIGSKIVPAGSVLMSCVGELGIVALTGCDIVINQQLHAFLPTGEINGLFLAYAIKIQSSYIDSIATKTTLPYLNKENCNSIPIPLPPMHEQSAIAALGRLIAKKRDIKQAAMQELLTGKRRLPGFSEEWMVKRLDDVLEKIIGGGTPSRSKPKFWGNELPWMTVKDFVTFQPRQTQEAITREGLEKRASHLIPKGTLITATRMALGKAVIYEVDVCINQDLKALFVKKNVSVKYLYYWFEHYSKMIEDLGNGSTVMGISISDLKNIEFYFAPLNEQIAIAAVLSDMDAEIAALEARREKTRALKQGMMQELLTGRIRLV